MTHEHAGVPRALDNICAAAAAARVLLRQQQQQQQQRGMCSAKDSGRGGAQQPDSGYRSPGLRGVRSTSLFRAVNPELFIKPNKPVMAVGLLSLTLCVGYLGYLHAVRDNQQQLYETVDSQGERHMRRKSSRWD